MPPKSMPVNRTKGDKSKHYTTIRQRQREMSRAEWIADFGKILDEIQSNKELWEWIWHERKTYRKKIGLDGKPMRDGRFKTINILPDTKEMPY